MMFGRDELLLLIFSSLSVLDYRRSTLRLFCIRHERECLYRIIVS
uniref:Uncharacterized protein n=1 Tax=Anopheles atroparvus TaxID=41427 RepID=A0AAG5DHJ7_ANOAO